MKTEPLKIKFSIVLSNFFYAFLNSYKDCIFENTIYHEAQKYSSIK